MALYSHIGIVAPHSSCILFNVKSKEVYWICCTIKTPLSYSG